MKTTTAPSYKRHRYPAEIIRYTLWLDDRLSMSLRDVEEVMAARRISLTGFHAIEYGCTSRMGQRPNYY